MINNSAAHRGKEVVMEDNMQPTEELKEEVVQAAEDVAEEITQPVEEVAEEITQPVEAVAEEVSQSTKEPAKKVAQPKAKAEKAVQQPKQKKKWTKGKIIGLIAAILGLNFILALCIGLVVKSVVQNKLEQAIVDDADVDIIDDTDDGEDTEEDSGPIQDEDSAVDINEIMAHGKFSFTDESLTDEYYDKIVATVGDHELTCGMFQIFYWNQFNTFMNQYASYISYLGLDTTIPMSEQKYGEEETWEQHFVEDALNIYRQYCALYDEAKKNNVQLSESAKNALDTLEETMNQSLGSYGYESIDDYIASSYGPGVTFEDYQNFYELYMYAMAEAAEVEDSVEIDEAEIEAYFDENAESYADQGIEKIDKNMVNVRHILIEPEKDIDSDDDLEGDTSSEEAWAAAEKRANEIYADWQNDPTEDNFALCASDFSSDPGSLNNGGLYEDIYPNQMVAEFNDWCFDDARKPGDTGIVKTEYGYHIMYYVGEGDETYWHSVAKSDCTNDDFYDKLDAIFERYNLKANYDNLHVYDLLYVATQAQIAADEAAAGN